MTYPAGVGYTMSLSMVKDGIFGNAVLLNQFAAPFTPARLGFYFLKTDNGTARRVGIYRWTDNFL
jgi:hypothetical protein